MCVAGIQRDVLEIPPPLIRPVCADALRELPHLELDNGMLSIAVAYRRPFFKDSEGQ